MVVVVGFRRCGCVRAVVRCAAASGVRPMPAKAARSDAVRSKRRARLPQTRSHSAYTDSSAMR